MRPGEDASRTSNDDHATLLTPFVQYKRSVDSTFASIYNTMFGSSKPVPPQPSGEEVSKSSVHPNDILGQLGPEYHPSQLRHLPPPVPNDLKPGMDGSIFTFEDAYVDLLTTVNSGNTQQDLRHVYLKRSILDKIWPDKEPPAAFHSRLAGNGFFGPAAQSKAISDVLAEIMGQGTPGTHAPDFAKLTDYTGIARLAWESLRQERDSYTNEKQERQADTFVLREAQRGLGEIRKQLVEKRDLLKKLQEEREDFPNPDIFEETVSWAKDAAASGTKSWDVFRETLREEMDEARRRRDEEKERRYQDFKKRQEEQIAHNSNATCIEKRHEERTDENGYVHVRITQIEKDKDGNELSNTSSYHMYPSSEWAKQRDRNQGQRVTEGVRGTPAESEETRKKSWFWK